VQALRILPELVTLIPRLVRRLRRHAWTRTISQSISNVIINSKSDFFRVTQFALNFIYSPSTVCTSAKKERQ
jgi:hypothetical protein